jgi:hypothetical protein
VLVACRRVRLGHLAAGRFRETAEPGRRDI